MTEAATNTKTERLHVALTPDLRNALYDESKKTGAPKSEIVRRAIEYWLATKEKD